MSDAWAIQVICRGIQGLGLRLDLVVEEVLLVSVVDTLIPSLSLNTIC